MSSRSIAHLLFDLFGHRNSRALRCLCAPLQNALPWWLAAIMLCRAAAVLLEGSTVVVCAVLVRAVAFSLTLAYASAQVSTKMDTAHYDPQYPRQEGKPNQHIASLIVHPTGPVNACDMDYELVLVPLSKSGTAVRYGRRGKHM